MRWPLRDTLHRLCPTPNQTMRNVSVLLLMLAILLLGSVGWKDLSSAAPLAELDSHSQQYLQDTMERAAAAFLLARALNGVISFLQSLTISPLVGEISPGELLDPVNDLVERFSWVMLAVTVAVGVQQLLLEIGLGADLGWLAILSLGMLALSLMLPQQALWTQRLRQLAYRLLLLILLIRFALPLLASGGAAISEHFLVAKQSAAQSRIEQAQTDIQSFEISEALLSPREEINQLNKRTEYLVNQVVLLLTLFLFETILLPLILLWGLLRIFRWLVRPDF